MLLNHITHRKHLFSIRKRGLQKSYALGRRKCCWVGPADRLQWAVLHVAERHNWDVDDLICIQLDVPPEWLVWHPAKIAWAGRDIPARLIKRVFKVTLSLEEF